jgi:hypothetical protein
MLSFLSPWLLRIHLNSDNKHTNPVGFYQSLNLILYRYFDQHMPLRSLEPIFSLGFKLLVQSRVKSFRHTSE